jgi:CheY-like chemotaxis protein
LLHLNRYLSRLYHNHWSKGNKRILLNETIYPVESNIAINKFPNKKTKISLNMSRSKIKRNNRILLVEDDEGVSKVIRLILRNYQYTVVECSNAEKAFAIFEQSKVSFALHIVDIDLPDTKGPELVNNLLLKKPDINILFTSGYNETKLKKKYPLLNRYPFLNKPFRTEQLLHIMELIMTQC